MSNTQYKACRSLIIIMLSLAVTIMVTANTYFLPGLLLAGSMAAMYYCRKSFQIGKAARHTLFMYAWVAVVGVFAAMAVSGHDNEILFLGRYLALSIALLLIIKAFLFKFLDGRGQVE